MASNNTQTITIQKEQYEPPRVIDLRDGISLTEGLLIILVLSSFIGKLTPLLTTGQKIYNTIVYLNKDDLRLQVEIQRLCDQLLAITYAQRVVIGLFHNGTQDLLGFHEKKMSVFVESCTDTIKPIRQDLQAIPINYMLEEILLSDTKHYQTITRSNLDSACDLHMDSLGIIRKDFRTFRGVRKEIYGIINFHYNTEPKEHFLDDPNRVKQVRDITRRIEHILETIKAPNTPRWKRFIGGLVKQFTKDD